MKGQAGAETIQLDQNPISIVFSLLVYSFALTSSVGLYKPFVRVLQGIG